MRAGSETAAIEELPVWMTVEELAARWRRTPQAIHDLRYRGKGPKGYRIGGKRLLFKGVDVVAYEESQVDQTGAPNEESRVAS